jgi:hypothetical protein
MSDALLELESLKGITHVYRAEGGVNTHGSVRVPMEGNDQALSYQVRIEAGVELRRACVLSRSVEP